MVGKSGRKSPRSVVYSMETTGYHMTLRSAIQMPTASGLQEPHNMEIHPTWMDTRYFNHQMAEQHGTITARLPWMENGPPILNSNGARTVVFTWEHAAVFITETTPSPNGSCTVVVCRRIAILPNWSSITKTKSWSMVPIGVRGKVTCMKRVHHRRRFHLTQG